MPNLRVFGDFWGDGVALTTPSSQRFSSLLALSLFRTEVNSCISWISSIATRVQVHDSYIMDWIASTSIATPDASVIVAGVNDCRFLNSSEYQVQRDFGCAMDFVLTHLGLPAYMQTAYSDANITYAGTWTAITSMLAGAKRSNHNGATAVFGVNSGTASTLYLYTAISTWGAELDVSLDGTLVSTFNCSMYRPTALDKSYSGAVVRLTNIATTSAHTITVTVVTSTDGTPPYVYFGGYAFIPVSAKTPKVFLGLCPRLVSYTGVTSPWNNGNDLVAARLASRAAAAASVLKADGLQIYVADTNLLDSDFEADGVSPNEFGNFEIYRRFMAAYAGDTVDPGRIVAAVTPILQQTDLIPASPASVGSAMALTSGERTSIATSLLDLANGIESGVTLRQTLQRIAATIAGKCSGAGTGTEVFKGLDGTPPRVTIQPDASGNRPTIVYN